MAADAQSTFTEQLQQSKNGEGKVTITQDKDIEKLVNTPTTAPTPATPAKPQQTAKPTEKSDKDKTSLDLKDIDDLTDGTAVPDTIDFRKKVMKGGTKVTAVSSAFMGMLMLTMTPVPVMGAASA